MKPKQANAAAERLKGLFPRMTDEQVLEWARTFEHFEFDVADRVITRFFAENEELSTPRLLACLRAATAPRENAQLVELADDCRRRVGIRAVDDLIDGMSDEELAAFKELVVASMPEESFVRARLAERDPRKSGTLRALIADRVRNLEAETTKEGAAAT